MMPKRHTQRVRFVGWLVSLCLALGCAGAYAAAAHHFDANPIPRVLAFAGLGIAGFISVLLCPDRTSRMGLVWMIWIPALLLRAALLPAAPTDDIHRYLWEGKLVLHGISPYASTVENDAYIELRDAHWEAVNHKDKPTAYPPLAQLAFAAANRIAYDPMAHKLLMVGADLLTLAGVLVLLARRGLPARWSGFYALNPVVLVAYAAEGHFDSLMVAALVWAVVAIEGKRAAAAAVLAAVSAGFKVITLPLAPFVLRDLGSKPRLLFLCALAIPALPFAGTIVHGASALIEFGSTRSFNGPVYDWFRFEAGLGRAACTIAVVALFTAVYVWRWWIGRRAPLESHVRWLIGAMLVLSPTVHFWYIAWLLPFVCLRPSMPWILLSFSASIYFMVWQYDYWGLLDWQHRLFWAPFWLACAYEVLSTSGRILRRPAYPETNTKQRTFSIVIPTFNAAAQIAACLNSIRAQTRPVSEVLIVDCSSTDGTVERARQAVPAVRIIQSERGRGQQIAAGIDAAHSDWVLVVHADGRLQPDVLERVHRTLDHDPRILGGSIGQRFDQADAFNTLLEVLNDLRSTFTRTNFGDQGQFFHRESAVRFELMPRQPLMEDVEACWRLRARGEIAYLGEGMIASAEKWRGPQRWPRFAKVVGMLSRYRWVRFQGQRKAAQLSEQLFVEYYCTSLGNV